MDAYLKTGKLGVTADKTQKSHSSQGKERKLKVRPWVEKYRPRTVDDVVEQAEVVSVLKQCLEGADLPNLLLYGPPGTGKTSTILAAARQLFGDMYKDRILELNASDDRGIQVVRDKVKTFAQLSASSTRPDGRPCPPFKIIILDEADSMTHAAQAALRRTMELYTRTTRFCLVCNYVSRIIPPLTSRCTKFRFKPLGKDKLTERLKFICHEENLSCGDEAFSLLVEVSGGDMRRAITILQSCGRLKNEGQEITEKDISDIAGVIPEEVVSHVLEVCRQNDYSKIEAVVEQIIMDAYSATQLLDQLAVTIMPDFHITDREKTQIFEKLGECSQRLQDGGCEYIQLVDLCCVIARAFQT